jgi:hypothetical protein
MPSIHDVVRLDVSLKRYFSKDGVKRMKKIKADKIKKRQATIKKYRDRKRKK